MEGRRTVKFIKAQLPAPTAPEVTAWSVPRTPTGMPVDMADQGWGNDRWLPSPQLGPEEYMGRFTGRPVIPFARAYAGVQRRNGVSDLDTGWTVPALPGSNAAYWQAVPRLNTPPWIKGSGAPHAQQGAYQVAVLRQQQLAPNLASSGMAAALFAQSQSKP
jgi:hypothetical protein